MSRRAGQGDLFRTRMETERKARGLSLRELAKQARVPEHDLAALEAGENTVYRRRLVRIADALGTGFGLLFDAEGHACV